MGSKEQARLTGFRELTAREITGFDCNMTKVSIVLNLFVIVIYQWPSARLQYIQYDSSGDTAVLLTLALSLQCIIASPKIAVNPLRMHSSYCSVVLYHRYSSKRFPVKIMSCLLYSINKDKHAISDKGH